MLEIFEIFVLSEIFFFRRYLIWITDLLNNWISLFSSFLLWVLLLIKIKIEIKRKQKHPNPTIHKPINSQFVTEGGFDMLGGCFGEGQKWVSKQSNV